MPRRRPGRRGEARLTLTLGPMGKFRTFSGPTMGLRPVSETQPSVAIIQSCLNSDSAKLKTMTNQMRRMKAFTVADIFNALDQLTELTIDELKSITFWMYTSIVNDTNAISLAVTGVKSGEKPTIDRFTLVDFLKKHEGKLIIIALNINLPGGNVVVGEFIVECMRAFNFHYHSESWIKYFKKLLEKCGIPFTKDSNISGCIAGTTFSDLRYDMITKEVHAVP